MTWSYRPKRDDLIVPSIYLLWGLPHHAPKSTEWRGASGMRVFGDPRYGTPHRTSRAILIYIATMCVDRGLTFEGSLAEINDMFQASWPMSLLERHFLSLVHSSFECTDTACTCPPTGCQGRQRVAFDVRYKSEAHTFQVTVSPEFQRCAYLGLECPTERLRPLVQSDDLASLDLLFWYLQRLKDNLTEPVGLFDTGGPFEYIKSASARYRKTKEFLRLHPKVVAVCPDSPFHYDRAKKEIIYDPDRPQVVQTTADVEHDSVECAAKVVDETLPEPVATPDLARAPALEQTAAEATAAEATAAEEPPAPVPARRRAARPRARRRIPSVARTAKLAPPFRPFKLPDLPAGLDRPALPPRPKRPVAPTALAPPVRPDRPSLPSRPQPLSAQVQTSRGRSPPAGPQQQWDALLARARALLGSHALEREG